ncbi:type 1 fimbrial protein [Escherichia coli]|nr:type 1 fimbrial protein [Escherichia coli]
MKQTVILIALFCSFSVFSDDLEISNNIELTFEVEEPSCTLETNDTVFNLGEDISYNQLKNGSIKIAKNFNVQCDGIVSAGLSFSGSQIDDNGNYLRNYDGDDYASGVMIRLLNGDNEEYRLNEKNKLDISSGQKFSFTVTALPGLISGHTFTPGLIISNVTIQVEYE